MNHLFLTISSQLQKLSVYLLILGLSISDGIAATGRLNVPIEISRQFELEELGQDKEQHSFFNGKTLQYILILKVLLLVIIVTGITFSIKKKRSTTDIPHVQDVIIPNDSDNTSRTPEIDNQSEMDNIKQTLSFFVNIAENNAEIVRLLYSLKVNRIVLKNPEIAEKIEDIILLYRQNDIVPKHFELTPENFTLITGIPEESISIFCQTEQLLLILLALNIDTKQISILLNTSSESIRTRKMFLKKKILQYKSS